MVRIGKSAVSLLIATSLLLALNGLATAGITGKIAGKITDKETGEGLPGTNLVVEGTYLGAAANVDGRYFILQVPPGVYTVVASIIGYQTVKLTNVRVSVDLTTTVDFDLSSEVVDLGAVVEIVAERALIQKDGVTTMQVISADIVESMVADTYKDVLTLNSGVTTVTLENTIGFGQAESGEGEFFVRGGRGNELAFMIDGMYARDGISGRLGTDLPNTAVEELQLISGNFNAEYGDAMSGVLNLVTREGRNRTSFRIRGFTDGIFGSSTSDLRFVDRDEQVLEDGLINRANWGTNQGQFSVGGPVPGFGNRFKYFLAGEYFESDGYIGVMQREEARSGTAKFTISPTNTTKLSLSAITNRKDQGIYVHAYAPDGAFFQEVARDSTRDNARDGVNFLETRTFQGLANWTHSFSANAFYELKLGVFSRDFFNGVSDDPTTYEIARLDDVEDWIVSGNTATFLDQKETVWQGKFDLTWQANINHSIKGGVDLRFHQIERRELLAFEGELSTLRIDNQDYSPVRGGVYLQDKMEFNDLIINAGLRLDYFDSADSVAADFNEPLGDLESSETTIRVSPRIGLAHPITDRASLHFSYGHFYQMPEFQKLINNRSRFLQIFRPTLGNANLKPQKTVSFEVGWDQQLTDFLALTLTGFYKDIENLVATDVYQNARPSVTSYFVNQDFANSRGLEINIRTRRRNHLASFFSYTISRVEGNSSDPTDTRQDFFARPPREAVKELVILAWDRPHVFNFNMDFRYNEDEGPLLGDKHWLENFGVNLTGRFQSGLPYTPTDSRGQRIADENSARMPSSWQLDLRVDKLFSFSGAKLGLFTEISNLTNRRNVISVWRDTGLADASTDPDRSVERTRDPSNIGPQRNIRIGFNLEW